MNDKKILLTVVGGTSKVGYTNCYLLHNNAKAVMIDCGIGLEGEGGCQNMKVYPNFGKHAAILRKIDSIFISHGHLDHVGALYELDKFLWRRKISTPHLFLGGFSYDIANKESRWERGTNLYFPYTLLEPEKGQKILCPYYTVETVPVPHSITDAYGFLFTLGGKRFYYAGDFRLIALDQERVGNFKKAITEIGKVGVDYALIECTNVYETDSDSEQEAVDNIERIIKRAKGRVIFSTFSVHAERCLYVARLAQKYGRPVYVIGNNIEFAFERKKIQANLGEVNDSADNAFIFTTGVQAEEESALMRALNGDQRAEFDFRKTDTVILSADPIPVNGVTEAVCEMVKRLLIRAGIVFVNIDVPSYYPKKARRLKIHASGHGKRQDLEWLIDAVNPRTVIPIHGDIGRREKLADITRQKDVKTLLLEEGETAVL